MDYFSWEDGHPTTASDECVSMRRVRRDYKLRDESCSTRYNYFCYWGETSVIYKMEMANIAPTAGIEPTLINML